MYAEVMVLSLSCSVIFQIFNWNGKNIESEKLYNSFDTDVHTNDKSIGLAARDYNAMTLQENINSSLYSCFKFSYSILK